MQTFIIRLTRSDEEKARRRIYGDKGAKFSNGKLRAPYPPIYSNTISTITKDNLLMELRTPADIITLGRVGRVRFGSHHQQDFVQSAEGISRAMVVGTHGNGQHYTKTAIFQPLNKHTMSEQEIINSQMLNLSAEEEQNENPNPRVPVVRGEDGNLYQLRIRKLTERECFRLMDVPEQAINKIQDAGISKSQQYKMAGNSIVVNVLYHIFDKLLCHPGNDSPQTTLF